MQRSVKNSIISTKFFIRDNKISIIFITLFTIGVVIGSLSYLAAGENTNTLIAVIDSFFSENSTLSFLELFSRNFISNSIFLAVLYIGGLCAIGLPFVAIIPIIKGISLGTIISYKYIFNGIKGFLYTLVIILIPSAVFLSILCFAYSEGIYMSLTVSSGIFTSKPRKIKYSTSFTTFTKRFILFSFGILSVSFIETMLFNLFSKLI